MARDAARVLVLSLSILALVSAGCAKRPALTQVSAPAPSGAAATPVTPPPPPVAAAPTPAPAPAPPPAVTPPAPAPAPPPVVAAPRPAPREFEPRTDLKAIHFDFDKSDIRPRDAAILDANARWLRANPKHIVLVEGHCDERGTNEYNTALGERRARATVDYLVKGGIQASRFSTISYGEERPLCTEHNERCWSQNRRAQFLTKVAE
jgi:peptidoglycan-associated lipoprotein